MQSGDDMHEVLAHLERYQESLMRIERMFCRGRSFVGPNVTLGFVELLDATGHLHPIPIDVCDSFEVFFAIKSILGKLTHPILFSDSRGCFNFYLNTTRPKLEFRDG